MVPRPTCKLLPAAALVLIVAACTDAGAETDGSVPRSGDVPTTAPSSEMAAPGGHASHDPAELAELADLGDLGDPAALPVRPGTTDVPDMTVDPHVRPAGIYAATTGGLAASVADIPSRVYVPNSESGTVSVVDPATYRVVDEFHVGQMPHHVIPSYDMQTLYVLDTAGNTITPIDPRTAKPGAPIPIEDPYNLYFSPDGRLAIVVAEGFERLDLYDPHTWRRLGSIPIPASGVNHGDFSPDGRYLYVSCEYSGHLAKVDLVERRVVANTLIGSQPIDVKLSPDAKVLFVADQARDGVIVVDPGDLHEIGFIPTGRGAHGLYFSRDVTKLYVSNRLGSSVSVIDVAHRNVAETWDIPGGGSPDMGGVSIDGTRLWLAGRYNSEVYVFDTATGDVVQRIATGAAPHGVAVFPQPGRYSLGHTGVYR